MKRLFFALLFLPLLSISQVIKKVDATSMWLRPNTPTLYPSTSGISGFSGTQGSSGTPITATLQGDNLTASAVVSVTGTDWEVATSTGGTYNNTVTYTQSDGDLVGEPVTISFRFKASATAGSKTGTATITSSGAATVTISLSGTVSSVANTSPTANAGGDQTITLPTSSVSLSGSGTDPDGTISSYLWERLSGPNTPTIASASSASTNVTGLIQGIYSFRLTVTDNLGATGSDNVQITVNSGATADTTYSDTAQFNLNYATQSISGWQDLGPGNTSPHTTVKSGTQNGYTLTTNSTGAWNGLPATTSDTNGEDTDDGGGFAHNATAQRSYMFHYNNGFTGSTTDCQFKLSGATPGAWYVIDILPSRDASVGGARYAKYILLHQDGTTEYTKFSDGTTDINATGNTSKVVRMYGKANASGELFIYGGGTTNVDATTQYAYFNTIRVYKMTIE